MYHISYTSRHENRVYGNERIRDESERSWLRRGKKIFSRGRENTAGKLSRRVISVFIFDGKERARSNFSSHASNAGDGCPRVHLRPALSFRVASYRSVIKNDKGKWDRGAVPRSLLAREPSKPGTNYWRAARSWMETSLGNWGRRAGKLLYS